MSETNSNSPANDLYREMQRQQEEQRQREQEQRQRDEARVKDRQDWGGGSR